MPFTYFALEFWELRRVLGTALYGLNDILGVLGTALYGVLGTAL